jgi:hypothetical protein
MEFRTNDKGVKPEVYILKTYLVHSQGENATVVNIIRDEYKHIPFVGDKIGAAPDEIGGDMASTATIVKVVKGKVNGTDVWTLTMDKDLSVFEGLVLVEADDLDTMMVKAINGVADSDADMLDTPATDDEDFDGARYMYTPALGGIMYTHKMSPMPKCVLDLNIAKINGWFQIQSV